MQKIILLTIISALFLGCSTKRVEQKFIYNYNHKPYIELKHKRKLQRLLDV